MPPVSELPHHDALPAPSATSQRQIAGYTCQSRNIHSSKPPTTRSKHVSIRDLEQRERPPSVPAASRAPSRDHASADTLPSFAGRNRNARFSPPSSQTATTSVVKSCCDKGTVGMDGNLRDELANSLSDLERRLALWARPGEGPRRSRIPTRMLPGLAVWPASSSTALLPRNRALPCRRRLPRASHAARIPASP